MRTENLIQFDFKYNSLRTRKMNYNIQSWPTKMQSPKFTELMAYNTAGQQIRDYGRPPEGHRFHASLLIWRCGRAAGRRICDNA